MICGICGHGFAPRLTFYSLLSPRPICRDCTITYSLLEHFEAIPTNAGLLQIVTYLQGRNTDSELHNRLWFWCDKPLKQALSHRHEYDLLLWIDSEVELMFPVWFRLFEPLGDIRVIALFEPQLATMPIVEK